jgi:hypothetical protein
MDRMVRRAWRIVDGDVVVDEDGIEAQRFGVQSHGNDGLSSGLKPE